MFISNPWSSLLQIWLRGFGLLFLDPFSYNIDSCIYASGLLLFKEIWNQPIKNVYFIFVQSSKYQFLVWRAEGLNTQHHKLQMGAQLTHNQFSVMNGYLYLNFMFVSKFLGRLQKSLITIIKVKLQTIFFQWVKLSIIIFYWVYLSYVFCKKKT